MAKTSLEKAIEKQTREMKDAERKRERDARKEATRERASSVVNGQPFVNGFRIMDTTAEEILKCLLACKTEDKSRVVFEDDIFPEYAQWSINIELEKLVQYGMIGGLISYDNGGFCDILPSAIDYFERKENALNQKSEDESMIGVKNQLNLIIKQGDSIKEQKPADKITMTDCAKWTQDVRTFNERVLKNHPVYKPLEDALYFGNLVSIIGCLKSVYDDAVFWKTYSQNNVTKERNLAMYDVFVSHANKDKSEYVNELKASLDKLKVSVFYDRDSLEWGDNWKNKILEGVEKAEFAIIVISENFFDREWTERELNEFLNRQNRNGQKIILPILHNITTEQLKERYPEVADIQALVSSKYSCDEIALKFASQLIKRLKE